MKNYCYICLLTACMAPMSLQAQKAIPYSGEVCVAPLPTVPTTLPGISSDSYARRFADSEMLRFPKAYQLDHGKRLFFGYSLRKKPSTKHSPPKSSSVAVRSDISRSDHSIRMPERNANSPTAKPNTEMMRLLHLRVVLPASLLSARKSSFR